MSVYKSIGPLVFHSSSNVMHMDVFVKDFTGTTSLGILKLNITVYDD